MKKFTTSITEPQREVDFFLEIPKYLPFFTIISFVYATIELNTYYLYFHINIFAYLEINEIILQVVAFLFKIIIILILANVGAPFIVNTILPEDNIQSIRILSFIRSLSFRLAIIILIELYYAFYLDLFNSLLSLFTLAQYYLLTNLIFAARKFLVEKDITKNLRVYTTILTIGLFAFYTGIVDILYVRLKHSTIRSFIINNNIKIQSTKLYYYVGQTNDTVFFYDEISGGVDYYYKKDITKIHHNRKN